MNPRYGDLLDRAKRAQPFPDEAGLSREEIDAVAEELRHPLPDSEPYYLLAILGESGAVWHRDLVEPFLEEGRDPWLAREALEVLCLDWGETGRYLEELERFVVGVPWDVADDLAFMAISCAGEYLRDHSEPRLLWDLLRIFEDRGEREFLRRAAYDALARAVGRGHSARSPRVPIDPSVLEEARQRLRTQGG